MASKITALTSLASVQSDDVLPLADVHDTTQASSGTTKKITVAALQAGLACPVSVLAPAFQYPTSGTLWAALTAAPVAYVVANIGSPGGPGPGGDGNYTTAINAAAAAGITVLGYVDTNYAAVSTGTVATQVAAWASEYSVTSIFLDRTSAASGDLAYYTTVTSAIRAANPGQKIVLNHGVIPNQGYAALADVLIVFENTYAAWSSFSAPGWFASYPRTRFSVTVHTTSTQARMAQVLAQAQAAGVGNVFVTDNAATYDTVPPYWAAEVAQSQASFGGYVPAAGGAMTGPLAMGASKITGLANGSAAQDAAAFGQIPAALPPNGTASGDLSGTYPAPAVAKIQGTAIAAPTADASAFLGSDGNWTPPPGFYPPVPTPRLPRTIITQFQSGHGFTLAGADASSNINDATAGNFVCGSQVATVVTKGDGATFANLTNTSLTFNSTGKYLLVRYRLSSAATVGNLELDIATESSFTNFYRWDFREKFSLGNGFAYDNEWEVVTLGFADATVTGSPTRSGLTAARLRIRDTGAAITCQWQEISLVDDPALLFPNGVVTICFDDGYQTQYDNGRPVMDQYGFRATMHLIRDGVGGSGSLTWAEVGELQNINGWEIGCHADTSTVHQANDTGVTTAAVETDWRDQKAYYNQNGYKGTEVFSYPSGVWNPAVAGLAGKYWRGARLTNWVITETFPPAQPAKLRALGQISSFAGAHSATTVNTMIDSAKANRQWLILIFHKIVTGTPGANTECSLTDFQTIMSHLSSSGVPVRTMGEVMRLAAVTDAYSQIPVLTAADTSIVAGGTSQAPTIRTGTLDVIAAQHAAAADWSNNSHKITSLLNGSGAQDAAAFGQIPLVEGTVGNIKATSTAAALGSSGKWPDSDHVHAQNFGGVFGDGSDGAVTFDGSTTILSMAPSSSIYTMTRDILCTSITINNGVTLKPAGYRIFCAGAVVNNGTITAAGANASGSTGGAGSGSGTTRTGSTGGAGGTGVSGAGGTSTALTSPGAGQGGNGGAGTSGGAGAAGAVSSSGQTAIYRSNPGVVVSQTAAASFILAGGTGGGGGGSDASSNAGGGGGGGGGMIMILAWTVNNGSGTITAAGGNAANAAGGNAGGGGGGGGGVILVYTLAAWTAGTATVTAGNLGNKAGTGSNGNAGGNGTVLNVVLV